VDRLVERGNGQVNPAPNVRVTSDCLGEVTDRPVAEFAPVIDRDAVAALVRQCLRVLDTEPEAALPEFVERLARQRLRDTPVYATTAMANDGLVAGSRIHLAGYGDLGG
jgi:hypothetical protein